MRDIKFRAFHGLNKEMVYFDPKKLANDQFQARALLSLIAGLDESGHAMQYTGLKDKNGVEIYEGDLVRIPADNEYEKTTFNCFEVFYHGNECIGGQNIGFCINRMHPQGSSAGGQGFKFTPESMRSFEVIGNIYQDSHLLDENPEPLETE